MERPTPYQIVKSLASFGAKFSQSEMCASTNTKHSNPIQITDEQRKEFNKSKDNEMKLMKYIESQKDYKKTKDGFVIDMKKSEIEMIPINTYICANKSIIDFNVEKGEIPVNTISEQSICIGNLSSKDITLEMDMNDQSDYYLININETT